MLSARGSGGGLILCVLTSYTMTQRTGRLVSLARNESAIYGALAQEMRMSVIEVQQWLTDISATRAQDGLADGFERADKAREVFLKGLERFEAMYQRERDTNALQALTALRGTFIAYCQAGRSMAEVYVKEGTSLVKRLVTQPDAGEQTTSAQLLTICGTLLHESFFPNQPHSQTG